MRYWHRRRRGAAGFRVEGAWGVMNSKAAPPMARRVPATAPRGTRFLKTNLSTGNRRMGDVCIRVVTTPTGAH